MDSKKNYKNNIKNNFYFFKYVFEFSKSYVISQGIISIIEGLIPLIYIIIPKLIIDGLINRKNFSEIVNYILIYILIQLTASLITAILTEKYVNLNGHLYAMHFLLIINKKVVSLDMAQLDLPETHQKLALAQDIIYKGIGINLINSLFHSLSSIVLIISTTIIIISADINLIFVIILFSFFSVYLNLKSENWKISQRDENIYLTRILNYYIRIMGESSSAKEMKMFGFVDWIMNKYLTTLSFLRIRLKKLYNTSMNIKIVSIIGENLKSNGIYLYLAWKTFIGNITVGQFSQYFTATSQLSSAILNFVGFITQLNINGKYIESFREFMELESDIKRNNDILLKNGEIKTIESVLKGNDLTIRLENVYFAYPGTDKYVLENINYVFEYGKVYVIVGENGAGKSTLINLISGLYEPTSGTIYLNNIPINQIDYMDYRNIFSIVFQDFKYFSFTIAENVALNKSNDSNEFKISSYLQEVGLGGKIKTLPKGIHTNLDKIFYEDGVILSGGENQKLALARALFRETPVIMLDEPSSALDPISEDDLLSKFKNLAADKLVIYISHRMTCASTADQIIFIKNKTIFEQGSHRELIDKNGDYAKYYQTQAKYYV
ncbi:ATP-binding cassette, subfamily C [Tissierella praeacuta DSM 18095]|uniref:ATP-binding cassette, subfamily C n=1 Tax=Tissierella praeacuta DSM 18095 TaxID=1123404 RepID=A0A1M4VQF8_9FIRM|nr:ABC transporter ATP-binding protein [Tissierella praeacuta]TCU79382.1 ATP-binding cassette subfamily B protein/ATP-binding cassette subfamily C protein [Tissierella praeacuta]SHE71266.1 ATP-binding cassette, subfamily C [Tissierella praeacuta DSM 18095]SUO98965.1 Lipid A export ATP-binding/permease protein MsbA [Tissierella praeacuta]